MSTRTRDVTVFTAGCPVCEETVTRIRERACPSCEVTVLDLHDPEAASRARTLGVGSVPAVAVDGELVACCRDGGPDLAQLEAAGLGRPLSP